MKYTGNRFVYAKQSEAACGARRSGAAETG